MDGWVIGLAMVVFVVAIVIISRYASSTPKPIFKNTFKDYCREHRGYITVTLGPDGSSTTVYHLPTGEPDELAKAIMADPAMMGVVIEQKE